ncbi:LrgB family protein [Pseudomonas sp. 102515]|uniref:LrgB family protein n=1 Tax=Pseudomonas sp. 102515 TaxID=3071568 RepID=UPI00280330B7|nr:LrgB family protein [Pseudomonas sp. 102515]MDQ7912087.1 LrgB family protein [Pseudomonas sp. 102515]
MSDPTLAPLLALSLTLAVYQLALVLQQRLRLVMLQPVLITTAIVATVLWIGSIPYEQYRSASGMLSMLLGPTTVGLAVPLYKNAQRVTALCKPLLITLTVGGVVGVSLTLALGWLFGLPETLLMSLLPKSVTMPIALPLADHFGGIAPLTAVIVMLTGVISTTLALPLLKVFKVEDPAARGLTLGMNGHAIGTAHALRESQETAAFSALGMILLGIVTALALPLVLG